MIASLFRTKRIRRRDGLEIRRSALHGLGLFAERSFRPGDLIEEAPLIFLSAAERDYLQWTSLFRYYFLVNHPETPVALGLGYSSLYSHASKANAVYRVNLKDASIILSTCKPIAPGEEITINYHGAADDERPVALPSGDAMLMEDWQARPTGSGKTQLYVKPVRGKGRGVFCRGAIKKDDMIEVSPVLVLPAEDYDTVNATLLSNYFFHFSKEEKTLALSLGFGSMYNHSRHSNAAYYLDRHDRTMHYYALEDIPPGKEICINYSGEPGKDFTDWFASRDIACSG